jgi:hypothetical protein
MSALTRPGSRKPRDVEGCCRPMATPATIEEALQRLEAKAPEVTGPTRPKKVSTAVAGLYLGLAVKVEGVTYFRPRGADLIQVSQYGSYVNLNVGLVDFMDSAARMSELEYLTIVRDLMTVPHV